MYNPPPYHTSSPVRNTPEPVSSRRNRLGGCIWGLVVALSVLLLLQVSGLVILFGMPTVRAQLFEPWLAPQGQFPLATSATETPASPSPASPSSPPGSLSPPPDSPRSMHEPAQNRPVLIEDDFDTATTRWDQSLAQVIDGTYEIRVETPNYDSYGLLLNNPSVGDFDMAVDVQQVEGDDTSEYGIRFRQSGPNDYLMFSISGSGYYRLVRVADDVYESLVPWTFDAQIRTAPAAVNRLHVVAQGEALTASINGKQVIEATDTVNTAGQLTIGVTTFDSGNLVVRFDNLEGTVEGSALQEDFSDPDNVLLSLGGARIRDGGYEIFSGRGIASWQQPLPSGSSEVNDFVLDVDASLVDFSSDDAAYGVMFGDGGAFDFYRLFLLPQGAIVMLHTDGAGNVETIIPPIPFDAVRPGANEVNHIHIEVDGTNISISLNGEQLPDIETAQPIQGMVGLIVSSGSGTVQARFDNFRLQEIAPGDPT